jgi:hypothetical protein
MFPGRSSDSQARPYSPDFPGALPSVPIRLSYLFTAAGQSRFFTGFPFYPLFRETEEPDHYILSLRRIQYKELGALWRSRLESLKADAVVQA